MSKYALYRNEDSVYCIADLNVHIPDDIISTHPDWCSAYMKCREFNAVRTSSNQVNHDFHHEKVPQQP